VSTGPASNPHTKQYIEVPLALFNTVPQRRARYILAYAVVILLWAVPRIYTLSQKAELSRDAIWIISIVMTIAYVVFFWNFYHALRAMTYPLLFRIFLCLSAFLPMPGLFAVAWVDIRIAKAWDAASPEPSYRKQEDPRTPES
jgi:hypothetical protein